MKQAPISEYELERIELLKSLKILDTELEETYDQITNLAAQICQTPIALISLVDEERQWFKSRYGLDALETPREYAFCSHTILSDKPLIVENALQDERFYDNPLVTNYPEVIFYAGIPLEIETNLRIGSLCVIDNQPRQIDDNQKFALECLAQQVVTLIKLRKNLLNLTDIAEDINESNNGNLELLDKVNQEKLFLAKQNTLLLEAKQTAENATRAKSNFLATMSHEIRNPMNAIIAMADLLNESHIESEQKTYVNIIKNSSEVLLGIINDLLDFSKIEADKLVVDNENFNVYECVKSALDVISFQAYEKGLKLVYCIDDQVPEIIKGDSNRLRQILINLLSNSVKFTEQGEIIIFITSSLLDKKTLTYELLFTVQDTGMGIAPDKQKYLFYPFSQADISITKKFGGTGLGLAISKQLAEKMQGQIWLESQGSIAGKPATHWLSKIDGGLLENAQGSRFCFTIKTQGELSSNSVKSSHFNYEYIEDKKVLILDNNPINAKYLTQLATCWKMQPQLTDSISIAKNWLAEKTFDFVIVDFHHPEFNKDTFSEFFINVFNKTRLPLIILANNEKILNSCEKLKDQYPVIGIKYPLEPEIIYNFLQLIFSSKNVSSDDENDVAQEILKIQEKARQISSLKILLVEDSTINQKVSLLMLKSIGCFAEIANNGLEAVEAVKSNEYDVILMDLEMPVMDGITATRKIHNYFSDSKCPKIIALTANSLDKYKEDCFAVGMNNYLLKPIRKHELVQQLLETLM